MVRLLTICGALRVASTNRLLLAEALRAFGPADVEEANLRLPLYDEDIETGEGIPADVQKLADQIAAADGVIIATPEYNKALSGVLKNALDWVSLVQGNPWADKPVALMSAADGRSGGERAQASLRLAMVPFRARIVAGPDLVIAACRQAFDGDGRLKEERSVRSLERLMEALKHEIGR
ncbi:MAG: NAD(P)H-dependent oxidoreductase [Rhodobacteraceae bacterium]|nr:NAD(P)H-dependent oxidoreductase [Paracoccaceae bacterium]